MNDCSDHRSELKDAEMTGMAAAVQKERGWIHKLCPLNHPKFLAHFFSTSVSQSLGLPLSPPHYREHGDLLAPPRPRWRCWSAALLPCGCGPWWYRGMSGQPCRDCPWDTQDVQRTNRPGGWHSHVPPCEPQSLTGRWSEVVYFWEENAPEHLPTGSSCFLFAIRLFLSKDGLAKHLVHGGPFIHPTLDPFLCSPFNSQNKQHSGYAEIPSDLDFRDGKWKPAYRG